MVLGAGPTVRLHLHEFREILACHDYRRGALIDHRLSQKDVVVFKPPNFGEVHAAARTQRRSGCLAVLIAVSGYAAYRGFVGETTSGHH